MKKLIVVLILALLAAPAFAGKFIDRDGPKVEGEYMCTFVDGANARGLAAQLAGANPGVSVKGTFNALNSAHFSAASANQIRGLANNPNVDICEPNLIATVDGSGSQSGATWGIDRVDQRNLPLNGTYIWDYDGANIDAWVLDTGVRLTHNEFGGRASAPTDCGYGTADGHGHGSLQRRRLLPHRQHLLRPQLHRQQRRGEQLGRQLQHRRSLQRDLEQQHGQRHRRRRLLRRRRGQRQPGRLQLLAGE
jgi:hypothetical protein